jgi:hypothetical protein
VSGFSRAFSSSNRVACDAVNDKPIAPADKRMDLRGKKAPAVEPAARAMAPTRRSRSWNVKIPLNQWFMKKWDSRETHINTGEFFGFVPPKWNEKARCEKHAHPDQVASLEVAKEEFEATWKAWKAWVKLEECRSCTQGRF